MYLLEMPQLHFGIQVGDIIAQHESNPALIMVYRRMPNGSFEHVRFNNNDDKYWASFIGSKEIFFTVTLLLAELLNANCIDAISAGVVNPLNAANAYQFVSRNA